jgi:hypothetical protein
MDLKNTIVIPIKENSYTVTYPNVGQKIKIEALKQELTEGQYGNMSSSLLQVQWDALEMVDVIAYFSVLIPQLIKDSKVSLRELDQQDFKELISVYKDKFVPWYNNWNEIIKSKHDEVK